VPRTAEELAIAAASTQELLESISADELHPEDIGDLRAIARALQMVADGEVQLARAVADARANGRSWARIALMLGTSRQAAAERFGSVSKR
jgi:hypothetical protein